MSSLPDDPSTKLQRRRTGRNGVMLEPPEYTIQEAAAKLGIAEQKLRRWDSQGVLVARRTEGGHRRYAREIIDGLAGSVSSVALQLQEDRHDELDKARQDIREKRRIIQLLVESESRYRDLVETSHDLIWTTDAVGRFTYLNNGAVDIFGLEPSALIGRCFFDFESRPSHVSNRRFLSTLRKHGEVRDYLTHLIAADGSDRWVGINARVWYDKGRIIGLRGTARNVTEQQRAALQSEHLALHDTLTDLPNQASLLRALEQSFPIDDNGALLRIDIDRFRRVNDDYGHRAGDRLLVAVSGVLRSVVAERDANVYRCGGDQFAVHIQNASKRESESLADEILYALRQFRTGDPGTQTPLQVSASVGIATYPPRPDDVASLLDNAEHAVNEAKATGRDRYVVFCSGSDGDGLMDRSAYWKRELRNALDEDRFELYSQPVVSLTNSGTGHRELLARIVLANGDVIESRQFIGAAETLGLAPEIDLRIAEKVLQHLGEEPSADNGSRYFVNLSRSSVADPHWLARFRALLTSSASTNLGQLVFELSETTAMSNVEAAKNLYETVRQAGCGTAIDNFGTGFTSMYYLKQFDVDYLKVDGSLSRELPGDDASRLFIRALCDITKGLNKEVIAERVESSDVLSELQSLGIDYAQGHFVGRPRPYITFDGEARRIAER